MHISNLSYLLIFLILLPVHANGRIIKTTNTDALTNPTQESNNNFKIQNYGHFTQMIHQGNTKGVVTIQNIVSQNSIYALGALENGIGEISIINSEIWLDHGKDGIGNEKFIRTKNKKAVLLVSAQVRQWQTVQIPKNLNRDEIYAFIINAAIKNGIDISKPFPFLLEGMFDTLKIHVINGKNRHFAGHGSGETFYKQIKQTRNKQEAIVIGFFSADNQGVYTHPGDSWHLHTIIKDEKISAHVDDISTSNDVILKIPEKK